MWLTLLLLKSTGTGRLEPLIILFCNWWTHVLERVTENNLKHEQTRYLELLQGRRDLVLGTDTGTDGYRTFRVRSQTGTEDEELRDGPDLSRGVGPSGSGVKLELKTWLSSLESGSLNILGGWSFDPILRFCFSRTRPLWYFLISINFISCQFTSFFFE